MLQQIESSRHLLRKRRRQQGPVAQRPGTDFVATIHPGHHLPALQRCGDVIQGQNLLRPVERLDVFDKFFAGVDVPSEPGIARELELGISRRADRHAGVVGAGRHKDAVEQVRFHPPGIPFAIQATAAADHQRKTFGQTLFCEIEKDIKDRIGIVAEEIPAAFIIETGVRYAGCQGQTAFVGGKNLKNFFGRRLRCLRPQIQRGGTEQVLYQLPFFVFERDRVFPSGKRHQLACHGRLFPKAVGMGIRVEQIIGIGISPARVG